MNKIKYIIFTLGVVFLLMPNVNALNTNELKDVIEKSQAYTEFSDMGYYSQVKINNDNVTLTTGGYDFDLDGMYESCAITFSLKDNILSYKADVINNSNALCVSRNDVFLYDVIRHVLKKNGYSAEGIENVMNNALGQFTFMKNGIEIQNDNYVSNNVIGQEENYIDVEYIKNLKINTEEIAVEGFSALHSLYSNYFILFIVGTIILFVLVVKNLLKKVK